jgi:hypothetical protein
MNPNYALISITALLRKRASCKPCYSATRQTGALLTYRSHVGSTPQATQGLLVIFASEPEMNKLNA